MGDMKTARAIWHGEGLAFKGVLGSGYEFEMGSPPGTDLGSPMEFLLAGVAGCTAVDVASILRKKRQDVLGLEVEVTGVRADEHPMVYVQMDMTYVYAVGTSNLRRWKMPFIYPKPYCSASVLFAQAGVDIKFTYRIEDVDQD